MFSQFSHNKINILLLLLQSLRATNMCSGAEAPTEQHEIFDGICTKPGGAHIHICANPVKYFTVKKFASLAIHKTEKYHTTQN